MSEPNQNTLAFIIVPKGEEKHCIIKGDLKDFKFPDFKNGIIKELKEKTQKHKELKAKFDQKDKLVFDFSESFRSDQLSQFWDEKTYKYFFDKIISKKLYGTKFKLIVEKVKEFKIWNPKPYQEILEKSLTFEIQDLLKGMENSLSLMKIGDQKKEFDERKEGTDDGTKKHINIMCENCHTFDFCGKRFVCSECNNYNLCQKCESLLVNQKFHNCNHVLIQMNHPLEKNVDNYDIIYDKDKIVLKNLNDVLKINAVLTNGEESLKNCFISTVRFGKNYLRCKKGDPINEINVGKKTEISLSLEMPQIHENGAICEGYFRMFTQEGLPFGKVINVKLVN